MKIELTSPQPWFMQQLSHTSFIPVNKEAVTKWGNKWTEPGHDVSDGPFTMTAWQHDASLTMVKNPDWYDASSVKLDKVVLKIITDGSTAEQAFNSGNVDVNETGWPPSGHAAHQGDAGLPAVPVARRLLLRLQRQGDPGRQPAQGDGARDRPHRRSSSTSRRRARSRRRASRRQGIPGAATINSDTFLKPTADMAEAQKYMAKVANPVKNVNLVFNNAPGHKEIAIAVQAQLEAARSQRHAQAAGLAAVPPVPRPAAEPERQRLPVGLDRRLPGRHQLPQRLRVRQSGNNSTNWCNKSYDDVLKQATAEPDQAKRYDLYQKAEAILTGPNGDMPITPIYWYTFAYQVAPNVHGWNTNPMDTIDLTKVSVG